MASPAIKANQQVIGMNSISNTILMGIGATLATDIWSVVRRRLFGTPMANYGLVGRWFLHMRHGKFRHEQIAGASKVRWEDAVGWVAHYLIGIAFAALFLFICDAQWTLNPTPFPALGFGIATVAAPFLLMQPGMGAGIAASRTARPDAARLQSIINHTVFGLGLYLSALTFTYIFGA